MLVALLPQEKLGDARRVVLAEIEEHNLIRARPQCCASPHRTIVMFVFQPMHLLGRSTAQSSATVVHVMT